MSDYCGACTYDVGKRTGDDACPFNVLYWDFLMRNEQMLAGNQRIGFAYKTLAKWSDADKCAIRDDAARLREEWE